MTAEHQVEIELEDGTHVDADGNPIVKEDAPVQAPSQEDENAKVYREINIANYFRGLTKESFTNIKSLLDEGREEDLRKHIRDTLVVMGYSTLSGMWNNPETSLADALPIENLETEEAFAEFFDNITKNNFGYEKITRYVADPENNEVEELEFYRGRVFVEGVHETNLECSSLEELVMNVYGLHYNATFVPFRRFRSLIQSRLAFSQEVEWNEVEAVLVKYKMTAEDLHPAKTEEATADASVETESAQATVKAVEVNDKGHELVRVQDILGKPTNIYHDPEIDAEYYIENGATVLL